MAPVLDNTIILIGLATRKHTSSIILIGELGAASCSTKPHMQYICANNSHGVHFTDLTSTDLSVKWSLCFLGGSGGGEFPLSSAALPHCKVAGFS